MTWLPPDDMNWGVLGWYMYVSDLAVELYVQGKSLEEVAEITGRSEKHIAELVWAADVLRSMAANRVLAEQRARARAIIAKLNIRALVAHWIAGVEVEQLAAKHAVPADLLWEALARELRRGPADDARDRMCVNRKCFNACVDACAFRAPAGEYAPSGHGWLPGLRDAQTHGHKVPTGKLSSHVVIDDESQRVRLRDGLG